MWDQCPVENAIGPKKTCDIKASIQEVYKGENILTDKIITIKNFNIFQSRYVRNEPELFLFIDNRNSSNQAELMVTIDNEEYWKYMRSRSVTAEAKLYSRDSKKQNQPDHKGQSLLSLYEVRGYLDNYKRADDIFVVEVLSSRSVGWRTIFYLAHLLWTFRVSNGSEVFG